MRKQYDLVTSAASSLVRLNSARNVAPRRPRSRSDHPENRVRGSPSPPPLPPPHALTLYDYEASPWCRLVREHLTILDLNATVRPCPRQTLWAQGAYSAESRFRPLAARELAKADAEAAAAGGGGGGAAASGPAGGGSAPPAGGGPLTFPILVDDTDPACRAVLTESYDIVARLWDRYGGDVDRDSPRPDRLVNSSRMPFPLRFGLLACPSLLRPLPSFGLMRVPSSDPPHPVTLYQSEGSPRSRLVREALCSLEISYLSVSSAVGTSTLPPPGARGKADAGAQLDPPGVPVLVDGDEVLVGSQSALDHLFERYRIPGVRGPSWLDPPPDPNLGQSGGFLGGAFAAAGRGWRKFVPDDI